MQSWSRSNIRNVFIFWRVIFKDFLQFLSSTKSIMTKFFFELKSICRWIGVPIKISEIYFEERGGNFIKTITSLSGYLARQTRESSADNTWLRKGCSQSSDASSCTGQQENGASLKKRSYLSFWFRKTYGRHSNAGQLLWWFSSRLGVHYWA